MASFVKRTALVSLILLLGGCAERQMPVEYEPRLTSIHIVDRNGFSETISTKERLEKFENTNFEDNQPYNQVLRVFERDGTGNVPSCITNYHPNGQPKQYLEVVNSRAYGLYHEWHPNGQLKAEAYIVGGTADLEPKAQASWLFDGVSQVWNDEGKQLARIAYEKGVLQGESLYYYPNGQLESSVPYKNDFVDGIAYFYRENGSLFSERGFKDGVPEGTAKTYWNNNQLAAQEDFKAGRLEEASYWDKNGSPLNGICDGDGQRPIFSKERILELQEFKNGKQEGLVVVYNGKGEEEATYYFRNDQKDGLETIFGKKKQPVVSIEWADGLIHGNVKTWYPNGNQESQREMNKNRKHGLSTAWYKDGNLMMIEEYDNDKLVKGEYFKKGERYAVSKVIDGAGVATLFDADGSPKAKITYEKGKPFVEPR